MCARLSPSPSLSLRQIKLMEVLCVGRRLQTPLGKVSYRIGELAVIEYASACHCPRARARINSCRSGSAHLSHRVTACSRLKDHVVAIHSSQTLTQLNSTSTVLWIQLRVRVLWMLADLPLIDCATQGGGGIGIAALSIGSSRRCTFCEYLIGHS